MKRLYSPILFLSVAFPSFSQISFQKTYGSTLDDYASAVCTTNDGGFFVAGALGTTFGPGSSAIYLIKTDSAGAVQWSKIYHAGSRYDAGASAEQAFDGGFVIGVVRQDLPEMFILKTDASGDTLWSRRLSNAQGEYGFAACQAGDSGYAVASITATSFEVPAHLTKFNSAGTHLWNKRYGQLFSTTPYQPMDLKLLPDNGFVMAGYVTFASNPDFLVIRTDSAGTMLWDKSFGGSDTDIVYSIAPTADSGFIAAGETKTFGAGGRDMYLIKLSSTGDTLWTRAYGGNGDDVANSVLQTNDGGYIVAGYTKSFGAGLQDVYIVKTNAAGAVQWSRTFGGTADDAAASIRKTSDGGFIVAGSTSSFGAGNKDVYLVKLDSAGNAPCNQSTAATTMTMTAPSLGSPANSLSASGTVTTTGWLLATGDVEIPLCTTVGMEETAAGSNLFIYPNPAHGQFVVRSLEVGEKKIVICDVVGRVVFTATLNSKLQTLDPNLSTGIYLIRVETGENVWTEKLIVE